MLSMVVVTTDELRIRMRRLDSFTANARAELGERVLEPLDPLLELGQPIAVGRLRLLRRALAVLLVAA